MDTLTRYKLLNSISRNLTATANIDALLDRIVTSAIKLTQASESSILLYDNQIEAFYFQVSTNHAMSNLNLDSKPTRDSIDDWIVTKRKSIIIDDVQSNQQFITAHGKDSPSANTLLGVPLITKKQGSWCVRDN